MNFKDEVEKRLEGGKFRFMNEKLGRNPHAKMNMAHLSAYHRGFRSQAARWPERPVDMIWKRLKPSELVVDMGCGEAVLAARHPFVVSLDLHPASDRVIACDMNNAPLRNESADAVVFCLSLMQEDAGRPLREGSRILRRGGRLFVAEAASRIVDVDRFTRDVERLGLTAIHRHVTRYFVLMEFKKLREAAHTGPLVLKPCVYKRR